MTQSLPTTTDRNRQLMRGVFAELAGGNNRPFREALADDIAWTIIGTTRWSRTYRGKQALIDELLRPLYALFADQYTATVHRIIADDDVVVVEYRGKVTTTAGKPYHNTYCFVCRLADGKIRELTEYCDTALIEAALP